jgi:Fe2+ or Zn2+ uptake regulation protein
MTPETVESLLRARGLRVTPQRTLVFRLVRQLGAEHPSAESVHIRAVRDMPSLSLRTVYTILDELEEIGAVRSLDVGTGSKRFCVNPHRHHHLVCRRCGRITDVFVETGPLEVPPDQRRGFLITDHEVVFRGICAGCRS